MGYPCTFFYLPIVVIVMSIKHVVYNTLVYKEQLKEYRQGIN